MRWTLVQWRCICKGSLYNHQTSKYLPDTKIEKMLVTRAHHRDEPWTQKKWPDKPLTPLMVDTDTLQWRPPMSHGRLDWKKYCNTIEKWLEVGSETFLLEIAATHQQIMLCRLSCWYKCLLSSNLTRLGRFESDDGVQITLFFFGLNCSIRDLNINFWG